MLLHGGFIDFAVATFLWFRKRRMQILDKDPDSLLENRELIFGPAGDRLIDAGITGNPQHSVCKPKNQPSDASKQNTDSTAKATTDGN